MLGQCPLSTAEADISKRLVGSQAKSSSKGGPYSCMLSKGVYSVSHCSLHRNNGLLIAQQSEKMFVPAVSLGDLLCGSLNCYAEQQPVSNSCLVFH